MSQVIFKDFEYDGKRLSDFNSVLSSDSGNGVQTVNAGNTIDFQTVELPFLKKVKTTKNKYGEMLTATLSIVKNPCDSRYVYTQNEANGIYRWLNRMEFASFTPIYEDENWSQVFYHASFNVSTKRIGNDIVGFDLEMITDAPFAYYKEMVFSKTAVTSSNTLAFNDSSDEAGYQYPIVTIKCNAAGTLTLSNAADPDNDVVVKNCLKNEVITFSGDTKSISSSVAHTTLYDDFNYKYPRVVNSVEKNSKDVRRNEYSTSISADVTITYSPICKVSVL